MQGDLRPRSAADEGDKALIGNSAYRRFLRPVSDAKRGRKRKLLEIDATSKLNESGRTGLSAPLKDTAGQEHHGFEV